MKFLHILIISISVHNSVKSQIQNSLHFDGTDDRVYIGDDSLLSPKHITLQAWIKIDHLSGWHARGIVTKRNCCGAGIEEWTLQTIYNGHIEFFGETTAVGYIDFYTSDEELVPTGVWVNYSGTYDGYEARLYKNGELIVIDTTTEGDLTPTDWPVVIGDRDGGLDWFPGEIDEVRIWDYALSEEEIINNIYCELSGDEPGLIAYYNFNEGIAGDDNSTVTTLPDQTANHFDGTLENFALTGETSNWVESEVEAEINQYFLDSDADGFGSADETIYICGIPPTGYVTDSTDCNDADSLINPFVSESCNSTDDNCNGYFDEGLVFDVYYADVDEDSYGDAYSNIIACEAPAGYVLNGTDCDDANNLIHEAAVYYADADGDSFGSEDSIFFCSETPPFLYTDNNDDCNDADAEIFPLALEVCNAIDDNCNFDIDEGLTFSVFYSDADGDSYGNAGTDSISCLAELTGYTRDSTDCDDTNPDIYPGAPEILDGLDNDCDSTIDENVVHIETIQNKMDFIIYPNPAENYITIQFYNNAQVSEEVILKVYDITGTMILQRTLSNLQENNKYTQDLTLMSSGIYSFEISGNFGTVIRKVIIL